MRKKVVFLGVLLVMPVMAFLSFPLDYALSVRCERVIDGDTFVASTLFRKFKVRLLYIDAPESSQGEAGRSSTEALKDLIEGKEVELTERQADFYGRTLARVYLNEKDINLVMIQRGQAFLYPFSKFKKKADKMNYLIEKSRAQLKKIGIYQKEVMDPYLYRKQKREAKASL